MLTKGDIDWLIDSMKRQFASKDELQTLKSDIFEKLDKFLGDIKAKREEQTLHTGDHQRIDLRISRLEKHVKLMPLAD